MFYKRFLTLLHNIIIDCPYQGPDKGVRNDPSTVPRGVRAIAAVRLKSKPSAPIRRPFVRPDGIAELESAIASLDLKPPPLDTESAGAEVAGLTDEDRETDYVRKQIRLNFRELFGM